MLLVAHHSDMFATAGSDMLYDQTQHKRSVIVRQAACARIRYMQVSLSMVSCKESH